MTTRAVKAFNGLLQDLFKDRTHWLRSQVSRPTRGKPPTFSRKKVSRAIPKLKQLATQSLLRNRAITGLSKLYDNKKQWHVNRNKGWGHENKKNEFVTWFVENIPFSNCVYIFWSGRKCCYIGRTVNGQNRPKNHFEKQWFSSVTRIDIYASKTARTIPKLECLATHRFSPTKSKIRPSKKKYYAKCPICEAHKRISSEVRSLFWLR